MLLIPNTVAYRILQPGSRALTQAGVSAPGDELKDSTFPLVSCVMVTRGYIPILRHSAECFRRQTYQNKELVVVCYENVDAIERFFTDNKFSAVRIVRAPKGMRLGNLRNIGISHAAGELIAQWDDDDLSDPSRLEFSVGLLSKYHGKECAAAFLKSLLIWWPARRILAISHDRVWENSMAVRRGNIPVYPALTHREDTFVAQHIRANHPIVLMDAAHLYVYTITGRNTFSLDHLRWNLDHAKRTIENDEYDEAIAHLAQRIPILEYRSDLLTLNAATSPRVNMRIVASMTTTPSRIGQIRPAIESVLHQSVPIDHLELNVPDRSIRTGEPYIIPDWLQSIEHLQIFRIGQDLGPISKIAPTLLRYRGDKDTYIWSIDDDFDYPSDTLELLCRAHDPSRYQILARHGGAINPDGSVQLGWHGVGEVSMFEGFGGVLYPPDCVGDDFADYVTATSANADCRSNDDMVLSLYFKRRGVPIFLNRPKELPNILSGGQAYAEADALRLSVGGDWQPIFKRIIDYVATLNT